jgi:hypothetical protein
MFPCFNKARQRATHTIPPTSPQVATVHFPRGGNKVRFTGATFTHGIHSREGRVICETMPFDNGSSDRLQIQHEDSQYFILLLCYLDKICLIPTGDLWQALADLFSEARL